MNFFENSLLPSNWADSLFAPKILNPFSLNLSTIPKTRGSSGPTIVKSILFSSAKDNNPSISLEAISIFSAN